MTNYHDAPDEPSMSYPGFHMPEPGTGAATQLWGKEWGWAQKIIVEQFENGLKNQFSDKAINESWSKFAIEQDPIYYPLLEGMDNKQLAKTFVSYWKNAQGMATRSRFWLEHAIARLMVHQAYENKLVDQQIYTRAMLRDGYLMNRKPVMELGNDGYFEHMTSSAVWRVELKTKLLDVVDSLVSKQERVPATPKLPSDEKKRKAEKRKREVASQEQDALALTTLREVAQDLPADAEKSPIPISCNLIVIDPNKVKNRPSVLAMRYINPRSLESPAQRKQERINILRLYAYLLQVMPVYAEQPNSIRAVAAEILPRHRITRFPDRYPKYFGDQTYWDAGALWHFVGVPLPIVTHAVRVAGEGLHELLIKQISSLLPDQQESAKEEPLKSADAFINGLPDATGFFEVGGKPVYLRPRKHVTQPEPWVLSDSWDRPSCVVSWSGSGECFVRSTLPTSRLLNDGHVLSRDAFEKKLCDLSGEARLTA